MKKGRVNKALPELEKELEFEASGNKDDKVKAIIDHAVYDQQASNSNQMPGFYDLVLWKGYPEEENS